ncbi:MAG: adenylate/guanylate cyclase domain-containing protein, partial [Rhodospirillales bacterium]|nr:adenylate/guanylate cyclase domain-containing protein [Rhodospirillales bacterium]
QAERRADSIVRAVEKAAPRAWQELLAGAIDSAADKQALYAQLRDAFAREVEELQLVRLNVYDLRGYTVFSTRPENIGKVETGAALKEAIAQNKSGVVAKDYPEGLLYELYVPMLGGAAGRPQVVFELYEPIAYLDAVLVRGIVPAVAVPGVLLAALVIALGRLVGRAQADIDARTDALNRLRRRLESFVSASAVSAAREAGHEGDIASRRIICTLFYSDVRDYSGYADSRAPEQVVAMINELMSIQVEAIGAHGGDVDKMIGDAVLARFDGDDAAARAVAAAKDVLKAIDGANQPRGVGIGVYTGEVVSGAVGPTSRRDFTVIGDAVNIAARLCSAAAEGELVVDAATVEMSGADGFGPPENITVKGRREPLTVRRWRVPS